jgi:hypothetical protein
MVPEVVTSAFAASFIVSLLLMPSRYGAGQRRSIRDEVLIAESPLPLDRGPAATANLAEGDRRRERSLVPRPRAAI